MQASVYTTFDDAQRRWRIVRFLLTLNLVGFVSMYLSAQWDIAEHAKGAVDRFWYPPHYGIYLGILIAALVPLAGLIVLLRAPGLPFEKLRENPALVMVIVANSLSFTGAPFDAWWHETFGLDLTIWSPPHLHILLGTVLAALGCAVYFLDDEPLHAPLRLLRSLDGRLVVMIFTLAFALLMAAFLVVEYEGGLQSRDVRARPLWSYPLLWPWLALFMIALFASCTRSIGMATLVMLCYLLVRLAILGFDRAVLDFRGFHAYPLVVPALAFDLALAFGVRRWGTSRRWLIVGGAALLATALVVLTTPLYWRWLGVAPRLTVQPWSAYWPISVGSGILGAFAGWWCGTALRRLRPAAQAVQPAARERPILA
ncbi:MAG TPA: hypothetical protein VFZ66_10240 [Herpetosiphonaceae bacterium]